MTIPELVKSLEENGHIDHQQAVEAVAEIEGEIIVDE